MAEKKITQSALKTAIKKNGDGETASVTYGEMTLSVKRYLSLGEVMLFVDYVVKGCYGSNGEYMPEIRNFLTDCAVLAFYGGLTLPEDIQERYDMVTRGKKLTLEIKNAVDYDQLAEITDAITERINIINAMNAHQVEQQLNDVVAAFEDVTNKMTGLFGGIDVKDVENVIKAVGDGNVDEEKLMKAYLENRHDGSENAE